MEQGEAKQEDVTGGGVVSKTTVDVPIPSAAIVDMSDQTKVTDLPGTSEETVTVEGVTGPVEEGVAGPEVLMDKELEAVLGSGDDKVVEMETSIPSELTVEEESQNKETTDEVGAGDGEAAVSGEDQLKEEET